MQLLQKCSLIQSLSWLNSSRGWLIKIILQDNIKNFTYSLIRLGLNQTRYEVFLNLFKIRITSRSSKFIQIIIISLSNEY